jgi:hypothetical protein
MAFKQPERKANPIPPITELGKNSKYRSAKIKMISPANCYAKAMIIENFLPILSAMIPVGTSAIAFEAVITPHSELIST